MNLQRSRRSLVAASLACMCLLVLASHVSSYRATARQRSWSEVIAAAIANENLQWRDLAIGVDASRLEQLPDMAPVVIERQGFEGEFPPPGWQVVDVQAQRDRVPSRYEWAKETCVIEPLVGGSGAAWAAGGGSEGTKLGCVTPYPAGAKIGTMLSYIMDLSTYPAGFKMKMRALIDQPMNERGQDTNFQIAVIDLDTSEGIAYNISSPRPFTWLPLELPEEDLAQFGGVEKTALILLYSDDSTSSGHVGVIVDNVVLEGLSIDVTATPTATELPPPTPTRPPTNTPIPRWYTYSPIVLKDRVWRTPPPTPTNTPTPSATPTPVPPTQPPMAEAWVINDTGGRLCYEVIGTGIGRKCYGSGGKSFYGRFPAGIYRYEASARCGSASGNKLYLEVIEHRFWCGTTAGRPGRGLLTRGLER